MNNHPQDYLKRCGLAAGVTKSMEAGRPVREKAQPPMSTPGPNARALSMKPSMSAVSTGKKVEGMTAAAGLAKMANIEGNESAKYEKMEKKTTRSLKQGGSEKELRAGHNEKPGMYKGKSMAPGGGGAFAKMTDAIKKTGKSEASAKAIAAAAGRKKFGPKKFAAMGAAGRRRAAKS